ncbi:MAG: hypothetical protein ACE5D3_09430, partial [Candidatus Binatia bacterium]
EPATYGDAVVYRAELIRIDRSGRRTSYRDCGDFSPYCVEALLDTLRSESHASFRTLLLKLDLRGEVSRFQMDDLARRFLALQTPARGRVDSVSVPGH